MTLWNPADPRLWPSPSQCLLLRAILLDGEAASRAWHEWRATHDPGDVGPGDRALLPTLYLAADRVAVEPDALATLRALYAENWARNELAIQLLAPVLRRFEENTLPAVVLKGVALLLFYFGDVGARTMGDVDVLIRQSDVAQAANVLQANGWTTGRSLPPPTVATSMHALAWRHPTGCSLDLHWRPFTLDCPRAAEDRLWKHSEVRESPAGRIRVPGAADLLILMCFHGRKQDHLAAGRWVADAMKVIERADPPIDWQYVLEQCNESGLLLPVRDALAYLVREFDAPVPDHFLHAASIVPARGADMARYRYVVEQQFEDRGLWEVLAAEWWRYAAGCRAHGRRATVLGMVQFYLAYKQWEWGEPRVWHAFTRAARAAIRRLRTYGFWHGARGSDG